MWLCLTDGFFSVVEDREDAAHVWVRARNRQHLVNLFPHEVKIETTPQRDYRYRVYAEKSAVAEIISARIKGINYGNFKNSVKDKRLKGLYSEFWLAHADYQDEVEDGG